jgi:uncharacterized protein (TIGR03546 family)
MITRQIGKLVRGSATPFQILAATVIASCLAFIPGFAIAPGLLLAWLAVLVIVNANLFLAGIVGVIAKLVALLLTPVSFTLGRWLLDSPLRGLFETLVNAPVFAWFGFEYPLVTGGQLVGLIFGVIAGLVVVKLTRGTWRKLAALEKDSAAFQAWNEKKWVRVTSFIFVGGLKGKQSYEQLAGRTIGNPVRILGVVLVVLLAMVGYVGAKFFDDAIVTAALRSGLERANGATVDLERASLDLAAGSLTLDTLALCDPDNVATNLFAAKNVSAKLSTSDLLRKRATVDLVTVTGGTQGEKRVVPGQRFAPPPEEGAGWDLKLPDVRSVDDVMKNAQVWKERLATVRRWLQKFSGGEETPAPAGETGPSYEDILRERIRREGYASIRDDSLVQKAPTLLIRRIEAAEVQAAALPGELLDITAENLSTQPQITNAAPSLSVRTKSGILVAALALDPMLSAATQAHLEFLWKGLSVDTLAAQIKTDDKPLPVSGGTVDISANGAIGFVDSRLPLTLTFRDTNVSIGGSQAERVPELPFSVEVRGPIDQPAIQIAPDAWKKAVAAVAKGELKRRATDELSKILGGDDASKDSGDKKEAARGLLEGVLGGKKKDAEKKEEPVPAPTQ